VTRSRARRSSSRDTTSRISKSFSSRRRERGSTLHARGDAPRARVPGLKKYAHLAGNYGGAWQEQQREFEAFPGAILMTTNCIQKPHGAYKDRIFTSGLVSWPAFSTSAENATSLRSSRRLSRRAASRRTSRRRRSRSASGETPSWSGGGGSSTRSRPERSAVSSSSAAATGAKPGRSYYTDLAKAVPKDCVHSHARVRQVPVNKLDFGDIGGIPRLLDVGQCNDSYSAIQIALALSKAFGVGVNELPLSIVLSWYEQKAVAVLLTLLYLGVKNIRIGRASGVRERLPCSESSWSSSGSSRSRRPRRISRRSSADARPASFDPGREFLNAPVPRIDDVDVAARIHGDRLG